MEAAGSFMDTLELVAMVGGMFPVVVVRYVVAVVASFVAPLLYC